MSNLVTLLSFDNRSIKALLSSDKLNNFDHEYPIFYTKRPTDIDGLEKKTAIDIALDNNQIQAVDLMIAYIVKH